MSTRDWCLAEFQKADRHTLEHDALILTPYAAAGWLLTSVDGDLDRVVTPAGTWWETKVAAVINQIREEETT